METQEQPTTYTLQTQMGDKWVQIGPDGRSLDDALKTANQRAGDKLRLIANSKQVFDL